ncbi:MAG: hypothetical protein LOY00_05295 [Methylocaldum sp.]|nr:hypothetical protein [Methylocaldum sp.]
MHVVVTPMPWFIFYLFFLIAAGWMAFVTWNAWTAFRRIDQRRRALLQASGVDCDLSSLMASREAWKASLAGKTMREILGDTSLISSENVDRP